MFCLSCLSCPALSSLSCPALSSLSCPVVSCPGRLSGPASLDRLDYDCPAPPLHPPAPSCPGPRPWGRARRLKPTRSALLLYATSGSAWAPMWTAPRLIGWIAVRSRFPQVLSCPLLSWLVVRPRWDSWDSTTHRDKTRQPPVPVPISILSIMSPAAAEDLRVLIAGAGVVGLTIAQGCKRHGIPFTIFERDARGDARKQGWALTLHVSRRARARSLHGVRSTRSLNNETPIPLASTQERADGRVSVVVLEVAPEDNWT
jgi:hypothetical protein